MEQRFKCDSDHHGSMRKHRKQIYSLRVTKVFRSLTLELQRNNRFKHLRCISILGIKLHEQRKTNGAINSKIAHYTQRPLEVIVCREFLRIYKKKKFKSPVKSRMLRKDTHKGSTEGPPLNRMSNSYRLLHSTRSARLSWPHLALYNPIMRSV